MSAPAQRSHRILALLELADEARTTDELQEFLSDPDPDPEPDVRRMALTVLSEAADTWEEPSAVFAQALLDLDESVHHIATELLGELREVLVAGEEFETALREASRHPAAEFRVAGIGALWRHRLTSVGELTALLADPEGTVRCEVVLGIRSTMPSRRPRVRRKTRSCHGVLGLPR